MLIGYFILFLAILIASIAAAIAASAANKNRSRSSRGGFYLVTRVIELFIRIWFYKSIMDNHSGYRTSRKKPGRPLHKAVFGFVFGEGDPRQQWSEQEKRNVIAYIQANKGIITLEELVALSGKNSDQAQQLINQYLLEYEGSPEVTDRGTIVYLFPELLRTTRQNTETVSLQAPPKKQLVKFSDNPGKTNGWISFFNVFNLLFSSYFLGNILINPITYVKDKFIVDFSLVYQAVYNFLAEISVNPNTIILIGLGIVPAAFSFFFFLIPAIRNLKRKRLNNYIKRENLLKRIYSYLFSKPLKADPGEVRPAGPDETPTGGIQFRQQVFDRFAAEKHADIEETPEGKTVYNFTEFKEEIEDVDAYRSRVNLADYSVGETVFDSGKPV
jgi:hypothetical protein